jgi:hypothetical protein
VLQVTTDVAASGIRRICVGVPSRKHLSSSGSCPLDLSGLEDTTVKNPEKKNWLGYRGVYLDRKRKLKINQQGKE